MANISGTVKAKCKTCLCVFAYLDKEVTGTCNKCRNKINHKCINEFQIDEEGNYKVVGKTKFKEEEE